MSALRRSDVGPHSDSNSSRLSVASEALSASFRVDLSRLTPFTALLRALPVTAMAAIALAAGSPKSAVTLAVGANLLAVTTLAAGRVTTSLVLGDVTALGAATFIGSVTANIEALHLALLCVLCLIAGLLVSLGFGTSSSANQAVIAFVVFGRFAEHPTGALGLGGLVAAGAAIEGVVLFLLRLPPPLRAQRRGVALAYGALAKAFSDEGSPIEAAESLDAASVLLSRPNLLGHRDIAALRSAVDEGYRIRIELIALRGLLRRLDPAHQHDAQAAVASAVMAISGLHRLLDGRDNDEVEIGIGALGALLDEARRAGVCDPVAMQFYAHLDALAGQLRAVVSIAGTPRSTTRSVLLAKKATGGRPRKRVAEIGHVIAGIPTSSYRHAIRLAVAVPLAGYIADAVGLPRGYWVAFTVVVVLRPDYSSLLRRGLGRLIGTVIGATAAALIIGGLHPSEAIIDVLIGIFAWAAYALWQASFGASIGFVTALVLTLLSTTLVDSLSTALDRFIDTLVGGAIALVAYLLWPTWSKQEALGDLAALIDAQREYVMAVLRALSEPSNTKETPTQQALTQDELAARSRSSRIAFGRARASVARALDDPPGHRIDGALATGSIAAANRIAEVAHSLRAEQSRGLSVAPDPTFADLTSAFEQSFLLAAKAIRDSDAKGIDAKAIDADSSLRATFEGTRASLGSLLADVVTLQLDELVDALNTLVAVTTKQTGRDSLGEATQKTGTQ